MDFLKRVFGVFSHVDTVLSWIGGGWKAGVAVITGSGVSIIAWLQSLDGLYIFILGLMVSVLMAALFHFVKNKQDSAVNAEDPSSLKPSPFDVLIREFKACDSSHAGLEDKLEQFVYKIIYRLEMIRNGKNKHDLAALGNPVNTTHGNINEFHAEILYVVNCLEGMGYINLEDSNDGKIALVTPASDNRTRIRCPNKTIRFNKPYLDFVSKITFHNNGNELITTWR